ncbi:MAG: amidase family protein [Sporolactobacillus sp.]|jgi:Asp-tRNA(Asn)/Glu-tRNA(Gln) amidotransferase A subunit family amidase|nr:amidase family protein [Sporolactobacillus sp.]
MYSVDDDILRVFHRGLERLREVGTDVRPADIRMNRSLEAYVLFFDRLWMIGLAVSMNELRAEHEAELSPTLLSMIDRRQRATAEEYIQMNRYRTYVWQMFQSQFDALDVIVSPTLAAARYRYDGEGPEAINGQAINPESDWMMTSPVNLTGEPACSLSVGFTEDGLPVGLQCIAAKLEDRQLFRFAAWAESILHTPTLAYPPKSNG